MESEQLALDTAGRLQEITEIVGIPFIYKSSFDKANRSSVGSYRGPGLEDGLRILAGVKEQIGVPVLTDVHEDTPLDEVSDVVDVLQTPAFLCRQTNFILSVEDRVRDCQTGIPLLQKVTADMFLKLQEMEKLSGNSTIRRSEKMIKKERRFIA